MPRKKDYIEKSQFGSLPPKVVVAFTLIVIIFVIGSAVTYKFIEDWTYLDSIYFAIITISTVGYGDITPGTTEGRVVTVIFTLISFCGIFLLFRVIVGYVVDHQIAAIVRRIQIKKKKQAQSRRFLGFRDKTSNLDELADDARDDIEKEKDADFHHGRNVKWIIHLVLYIIWLVIWTLFYTLHPEEEYSVGNALYFGIITSTTIGYGRFVPLSDDGKLFCCITTILGTLTLGVLAGSISQGLLAIIRATFKNKGKSGATPEQEYNNALDKLLAVPKSGNGKLTQLDFVLAMLIESEKCKESEIKRLLQQFEKLDVNNDGVVDEKDFNVEVVKQETLLLDNNGSGGYQNNNNYNNNNHMQIQMTNNVVQSASYDNDEDDIGLR